MQYWLKNTGALRIELRLTGSDFLQLDAFVLPILHGSVQTLKVQGVKNKAIDLTLIARRSSERIGTRMWRRGADKAGNVANFVETEQLVLVANHVASYIQVRLRLCH
jgi:hypothetical protein